MSGLGVGAGKKKHGSMLPYLLCWVTSASATPRPQEGVLVLPAAASMDERGTTLEEVNAADTGSIQVLLVPLVLAVVHGMILWLPAPILSFFSMWSVSIVDPNSGQLVQTYAVRCLPCRPLATRVLGAPAHAHACMLIVGTHSPRDAAGARRR